VIDGLDFEGWDETDFEEFSFQLVDGLEGFSNVDWRKGTPKQASPADRGRDIVAQVDRIDVDGSKHVESGSSTVSTTRRASRQRRFRGC